jgi:hypothetical protein
MSTITVHPPTGVAAGQRPTATWIGNLVTALGGLWMVGGLFYDGHTHVFTPELESFFTPAHGVLYSGFLATAGWVLVRVLRAWRAGHKAPAGYGLGLLAAPPPGNCMVRSSAPSRGGEPRCGPRPPRR